MNIYLDNASTSFPKPKNVSLSVSNYIDKIGGNPGRGCYDNSLASSRIIYNCRLTLSKFFSFNKPENIIFTQNITYALNTLLLGAIKPNSHIITSSMEHNSVLRVLYHLENTIGIELEIIDGDSHGFISAASICSRIKSNTQLVVLSHASNVTGSIQPLIDIGKICKENNIIFIIDSAQSAGSIHVDFTKLGCNGLTFTGHKSLLGPQGIGGFIIDDMLNNICSPLVFGGTGSESSNKSQPLILPDKFESGTQNIPGILGLMEGLNFINSVGLDAIIDKKHTLSKQFLEGFSHLKNYILYGSTSYINRVPTFSINHNKLSPNELEFILNDEFNINTRSGLHCAPLSHKTISTFPNGTLRISFGYFNDTSDIIILLDALKKIDYRM